MTQLATNNTIESIEDTPFTIEGEEAPSTIDRGGHSLVADAKRYRKRAQAAEQALEGLTTQLAEREQKLQEREQTISDLQRQQSIDQHLFEARAMDANAARVLIEAALKETPEQDVAQAVSELRRQKPYLFQHAATSRTATGALAPKSANEPSAHEDALEFAATEALSTGKRGDLLRYLRLRRNR